MRSRFLVIPAAMMLVIILCGCTQPTSNGTATQTDLAVSVTFEVVDAQGELIDSLPFSASKGSNAFEVMREAFGEENVSYTDYGPGLGALVTGINGIEPGAESFWKLYVDGEESPFGISLVTLEEDTVIRWQLCPVDALNRAC